MDALPQTGKKRSTTVTAAINTILLFSIKLIIIIQLSKLAS